KPFLTCTGWCLSKPLEHQPNHCGIDHRLACLGQILIVFAHPPIASYPSERTLDDPATRQHHKGWHERNFFSFRHSKPAARLLDDLYRPVQVLFDPLNDLAAITHVSPHMLQVWKLIADIAEQ